MTSSIFWRLLWKEYRTQLSLWLSIATVSIAIQLLAMLWISLEHSPQVLPLYVIAFAMPCFFVLGYAGTTFAVEHELQTYEFLRVLPTRSRIMFVAKALVALASTLCLFLMLWLSAYGMAGGKVHIDSSDSLVFQAAEVGLTAVELFAWGVCFSLIMKQPIKALVFAAIGTIVGRLALVAIVNVDMGDPNRGLDAQTVTVRIVYAGLILLLDLVLAGYWFGEKSVLAEMMRRRAGCRTKHVLPDTVASLTGGRNARTGFLRLAWQELREARWLMAAIGILALLTLTFLGFRPTMMDGFLGWAAVLICVCGASTFLADHAGNRFRFLTEKGVSPTSVWLSRQLVWLFLALPIGVAAITLAATSHDAANVRSQERLDLLTRQGNWSWWAVLLITSFTVGEFCSPLLRNGIIAWSASIAGVCLFSFWWMLMFVLGVPIWSVAVVPAILLLGSWRNASYMLVDNPGWRSQLGSLLWTIIPGAILVSSIIGYRSWQIPDIDPGFRVEDSRRPLTDAEQQLQTEFFAKVAHLRFRVAPGEENPGSLSPEELKWLGENQELLKLAKKMSKQRTTLVFDPSRAKTFVESARLLPNVLGFDARRLLGEGKIQESFERTVESLAVCRLVTFGHYMEPAILTWLPTWAAAPNQTPDIITDARKRLSEFFTDAAASSDDIRWQHVWMEYALAQKDPYGGASTTDQQMFQKIWQLLSWERTRSRRLLNQMSHGLLANLDHVEASLRRGVPFHELALIDNPRIGEWQRSTIPWFQDQYHQELASQSHSRYTMEATRRVTDLHLALQTWKLTHHGLPRTLEEMVGTCLDKIPLDPYSNQPIAYFPDGWPEQLVHKHVAIPLGSGPIIPASTPFVWIAGPNTINTSSRPMQLPLKYDGGRIQVFRSASSKQEWLEFGMIFRIPERL